VELARCHQGAEGQAPLRGDASPGFSDWRKPQPFGCEVGSPDCGKVETRFRAFPMKEVLNDPCGGFGWARYVT
jgi:hypothetical protein